MIEKREAEGGIQEMRGGKEMGMGTYEVREEKGTTIMNLMGDLEGIINMLRNMDIVEEVRGTRSLHKQGEKTHLLERKAHPQKQSCYLLVVGRPPNRKTMKASPSVMSQMYQHGREPCRKGAGIRRGHHKSPSHHHLLNHPLYKRNRPENHRLEASKGYQRLTMMMKVFQHGRQPCLRNSKTNSCLCRQRNS